MTRLDRRSFLRSSLGALAALPFVGASGCGPEPGMQVVEDPRLAIALERALAWIPRDPAERLGFRYLDDIVPSHDPGEVAAHLEPILALLGEPESDDEALDALAERIEADFDQDAVHDLEGWTLSTTELGVCMLVAVVE
jgi:hypothetical protein